MGIGRSTRGDGTKVEGTVEVLHIREQDMSHSEDPPVILSDH